MCIWLITFLDYFNGTFPDCTTDKILFFLFYSLRVNRETNKVVDEEYKIWRNKYNYDNYYIRSIDLSHPYKDFYDIAKSDFIYYE